MNFYSIMEKDHQTTFNRFLKEAAKFIVYVRDEAAPQIVHVARKVMEDPTFLSLLELSHMDEVRRQEAMRMLVLGCFYFSEKKGNIYAWEAIAMAHRYELVAPEWATAAIAGCAEAVVNVDTKNFEPDIKKALGINGHSLNKIKHLNKHLSIFFDVKKRMEAGASKTAAQAELAETYQLAESTLKHHYRKIEKILQDPIPDEAYIAMPTNPTFLQN